MQVHRAAPDSRSRIPKYCRELHALLVEDNRPLRELMAMALTVEGFTVTEAFDAESMRWWLHTRSHERYPEEAFDLIVTDVNIPGETGLVALQRLRHRGCHIPAIVVTAFAEDETRQQVTRLRAQLISKPFKLDDIRSAAVAAVIDRLPRTHST